MELQEILRRIVRNGAMLLGSRILFGLLNLGSSALVVRLYGLNDLGVVVLLQAYVRLISEAVKFESWQAVLTYGARLIDHDRLAFKRLLGLTLGIDIVSVTVGILVGLVFLPWAAGVLEWPDNIARFAPLFLLTIPFITHGTPNGVLRLTDRVDVLALQHGLNATARFAGVLLVWWSDTGVMGLVLAWFSGSVLAGIFQWVVAFRELSKRRMKPRLKLNLRQAGREFPGIWRFLAFSNVSTSLGIVYNAGTTMFIGATLGATAAATLQIAQQIINAIGKPMRQFGPIIAPELAKLAAANDWSTFRSLILRQIKITALIVGALGALLLSVLDPVLSAVYGDVFLKDIWLFRLLIISSLVSLVFFSLAPAFLSVAKAGTVLAIRTLGAIVYACVTLALLDQHGIIAVGYGVIVSMLVSLACNLTIGGRLLRDRLQEDTVTVR